MIIKRYIKVILTLAAAAAWAGGGSGALISFFNLLNMVLGAAHAGLSSRAGHRSLQNAQRSSAVVLSHLNTTTEALKILRAINSLGTLPLRRWQICWHSRHSPACLLLAPVPKKENLNSLTTLFFTGKNAE